jgi:SSS family solute:Na+ symporter
MLHGPDLAVLVGYLILIAALGAWFGRRGSDSGEFMAGGRALPGWAVGLSMFGSYVSSISFLANTGKAYGTNWNALAFSFTTPIAAAVAVRWFMPFYRQTGHVSAYEHFETRFGAWARTYAVACFLLTQMARMGTIVLLLGGAVAPLTGWDPVVTIVISGVLMTAYTMGGGIKAVVWVGVLQSAVLVAGVAACLFTVIGATPGGLRAILEVGAANDKFTFGQYRGDVTEPALWVVLAYGLAMNLSNFGVDQSFIQRYISARSDRDAAKSIWLTAILYVPVAAVFFFLGAGLFVLYSASPELLPAGIKNDDVLPHFIATQMPVGIAGLVVASLFAASLDSNLGSMATLTLCDVYQPYVRPQPSERESIWVLRLATLFWGAAGTAVGIAMISAKGALNAWWDLAGLFSGGTLGLFLLGLCCRRAGNAAGAIGVAAGVAVITWMTLPKLVDLPEQWRSPLHSHMTIVVGTLTIFLVGLAIASLRPERK